MSEIDEQALEWVAREGAGPLDPAEQAAFEAWYLAHPRHQGAYLRARAISHSLGQVTVQASLEPRPARVADDAPPATEAQAPMQPAPAPQGD